MKNPPIFPVKSCRGVFAALAILAAAGGISAQIQPDREAETQIYFNAAAEKYIQGDIDSAVANADKAIALDPSNRKYLDFAAKALYDGAQEAHTARNYRKALEYLEKAKRYNPADAKISNLYDVTKNLLEKSVAAAAPAPPKQPREPAPVQRQRPPGEIVSPPTYVRPSPQPQPAAPLPVFSAASLTALSAVFLAMIAALASALKKIYALKKNIAGVDGRLAEVSAAKTALTVEIEKLREAVKYEKEISARLSRELKDEKNLKNRQFEEQLKLGMDIRQKQLEEILKSAASARDAQRAAVHVGRAKVLETIGDATYIDEDSSAALEAARERIAGQARELYKVSQSGCMNFLKDMAANPNPLIRANIAKALAALATVETVDILVEMWRDPHPKVKRESLREIKNVYRAASRGEITLAPASSAKIVSVVEGIISGAEWIF